MIPETSNVVQDNLIEVIMGRISELLLLEVEYTNALSVSAISAKGSMRQLLNMAKFRTADKLNCKRDSADPRADISCLFNLSLNVNIALVNERMVRR